MMKVISAILILNPIAIAIGLFNLNRHGKQQVRGGEGGRVVVGLRLPQCAACTRKGAVVPVRVDYDYQRMELKVHGDFLREYRLVNEQVAPTSQN